MKSQEKAQIKLNLNVLKETIMANARALESASGKGLVRFRMDDELRIQTEHVLDCMGLSMASVMTMLSKRIVAEGKLPFEIYAVSVPNEITRRAMMESRAIINNNGARFGSAEELFSELEEEEGGVR